ncbi:MAG: transporter substrate-binding domain-containing protein [Paludibacter sp.]|jgi:membrane-bound lytic murein transglycosylase F|nr:transporter substrate-binding domain-containing protein [Paludibacter sp.]
MNKLVIIFIIAIALLVMACEKSVYSDTPPPQASIAEMPLADTLRAGVLPSVTSYFAYRDENIGFDLEMAENLAKELNVKLKIIETQNQEELLHLLSHRKIDIVISPVYQTLELKRHFAFVYPHADTRMALVQRLSTQTLNDVTELAEKKIYVKRNTLYHKRLLALHDELGGAFEIIVAADSLSEENLIEMVAENKIDYTVTFQHIGLLFKSYYKNLDVRLPVGFAQRNGWLVRKTNAVLAEKIDEWLAKPATSRLETNLTYKYFNRSPYFSNKKIKIPKGAISPYDAFFKKYAAQIAWDWRILAAVAFNESRFDSSTVSWVGAAGVMQLMPRTAARFGLDKYTVFNPEKNIEAGVQYIKSLNLIFRKIEDENERIKFILGAYNSGPAHVLDAMALAKKYGKNPHIWFGNVEYFLDKKSEPEFFNDSVVRYGQFNAAQTIAYVENTLETYQKYIERK